MIARPRPRPVRLASDLTISIGTSSAELSPRAALLLGEKLIRGASRKMLIEEALDLGLLNVPAQGGPN